MDAVVAVLEERQARTTSQSGGRIEFHFGVFAHDSWDTLSAISSGNVEVHTSGESSSIAYHLRFTALLLFATLCAVAIAVWMNFFSDAPASSAIAVPIFVWFFIVGANGGSSLFFFRRLLRKAVRRADSP